MAAAPRKLKVINRMHMRQVPNGLDFVHWAAVVPNTKSEAANEDRMKCVHHGVHGHKTATQANKVTCPTCRLAMIKAGEAKAVPKFGTKTADGRAVYL